MADLIFGLYPEILGGTGQYILLERATALAAAQAFKCRTWGEFAELAGIPWEELYEEWADDYNQDGGPKRQLRPTSRFRYANIVFGLRTGPELPHPAEVAYRLVHASPYVRRYIVARELEFNAGTPAGNLECVTAESNESFLKLQDYLARETRDPWSLGQDDRLVRRAMGAGR